MTEWAICSLLKYSLTIYVYSFWPLSGLDIQNSCNIRSSLPQLAVLPNWLGNKKYASSVILHSHIKSTSGVYLKTKILNCWFPWILKFETILLTSIVTSTHKKTKTTDIFIGTKGVCGNQVSSFRKWSASQLQLL